MKSFLIWKSFPREEAVRHLAYIRKQDLLVKNGPTPIKTTNKIEHELSEKELPKFPQKEGFTTHQL
jgi:hypothetical protein